MPRSDFTRTSIISDSDSMVYAAAPSYLEGLDQTYSPSLSNIKKFADCADYHFKPSPFYTRWVYGYNHKAGVINLNSNGSTTLFYAASNFGILYNWTRKQMKILQGHRHMVTCIAADASGRWLVTADTGLENVVIIWDSVDYFPNRTIFVPHRNNKLARVALSADAKYLLTMTYLIESVQLYWWIWSYGLNEPHATFEIQLPKDSVLAMDFNPTNSELFALLTKDDIYLGFSEKIFVNDRGIIRDTGTYRIRVRVVPKDSKLDAGRLTCYCFVATTGQILVGTNRGLVLVYSATKHYAQDPSSASYDNLKYVKPLKIDKCRITVIQFVDNVVVTGNSKGEVSFYDDQLKLLYWVHEFKVDRVSGLSFNLVPRSYIMLDPACKKTCECWEKVVVAVDPQTGQPYNKLLKSKIPQDCTKGAMPFIVRDFIITCPHQGIGFVDMVPEKNHIILDYKVSPVLAVTVHPEKKLVCVGFMNGNIELLDYIEHKVWMRQSLREFFTHVIPPDEKSIHGDIRTIEPHMSVTCLKYSPSGVHLACGLNTGQLLFLHPTTIEIKTPTPYKDTSHAIKKMEYSPDSSTLALSDTGKTICVYKYDCEQMRWTFIAKHRSHSKDINSMLYLSTKNPDGEYKLLSFGADRAMADYDVGSSVNEHLKIMSLKRIEQTAVPLHGIEWPAPEDLDPESCHTHNPTILVANDENKYKIMNYETSTTLATYLGPRFEHPVKNMRLVSLTLKDEVVPKPYLLFFTKIIIGLQKMPLDGNPWKHVGMLGHPNQIINTCFREDDGYLFTIGTKDSCMTQWQANPRSVEKTTKQGGVDLDPYYCLIENGRPGWLFQEIRDHFYYIQVLCQGTFSPAMRGVKDVIPIDSLPDIMRALGFFPSDYEVENLLVEAKYEIYKREPRQELNFEEFVKLYINHRPAFLYTSRKIGNAFKVFAEYSKKDGEYIYSDDFVEILTSYGEKFTPEMTWYLLSILYGHSFEERAEATKEDFSFLPRRVKLTEFTTSILGIPDFEGVSDSSANSMGSAVETGLEESDQSDYLGNID